MNNIFNDYIKLLYLNKFLIWTDLLLPVPDIIFFIISLFFIIIIKIYIIIIIIIKDNN